MSENFFNVYQDKTRAESYDGLEFPGTYFLAFRDLPAIIHKHTRGRRALDFGCGAGRSTRFLKQMQFQVIGADISEEMLALARKRDPDGEYLLLTDGDLNPLASRRFDLILSAFTFDNIASMEKKVRLFDALRDLLAKGGCIINLVSSPEIYHHEWTSFSTKDFPENHRAKGGDKVRIIMLDVPDRRPVEDIFWTDEDYRETYRRADLVPVEVHRPLATATEPYAWVTETRISPWTIYLLKPRH
jgi:SAM-dependent methyltransferase